MSNRMPLIANSTRYLVEPLAFGGLVLAVVVLAVRGRDFSDILPNLGVMAVAGYRLLPTFPCGRLRDDRIMNCLGSCSGNPCRRLSSSQYPRTAWLRTAGTAR